MLDYNILMLVHPSSGDNIFYKVRDGNCIILIDSFGNEPQKEVMKNYTKELCFHTTITILSSILVITQIIDTY